MVVPPWERRRARGMLTPRRLGGVPLHPVSLSARYLPLRWQDATARSMYGNMHVHRRQARRLARAITRPTAQPLVHPAV